jgi:imidazole glycerol phosphate synthase glutamine amidotransferase subunit
VTTIVNYGAGNLRSVQNTLEEVGCRYQVTDSAESVLKADKLILPGVGHFGQMVKALDRLNLREPIKQKIELGTPFLGICVGLQYLFERSEESPDDLGLAVLPGTVKRFRGAARVPHMGWNSLLEVRPSHLLRGVGKEAYAYFAHSFYAPIVDETAATCSYLGNYTALIEAKNLFAVQFHPEKSGSVGLRVLQNFAEF